MGVKQPSHSNTSRPRLSGDRLQSMHKPVLLLGAGLFWASLYTYPATLSPYLSERGTSLTVIGLVISSYGLTQMILRLPVGILSDRLRNKRAFIITGMALSLISGTGLYLARQVGLILLFRAMAGVAATTWVHFTTLYLSYHPAGESARAMGQMSFCNSIGMLTAIVAGSFLAEVSGSLSAFLLAALVAAMGLIVSFAIWEDRPDAVNPATSPPGLREVLHLRQDWLLFWTSILALLSQLVNYATLQGFVPQYASRLGASKAEIGLLTAFAIVPRALAGLFAGSLLARRFRVSSLIFIGFVLVGSVTCLLPLIHGLSTLLVSQFFSGLGNGLQMVLLLALCTQTVAADRKASAMGFFQAVYAVGMVIGPALLGYLADEFGLEAGFVVVGLVSMLGAILVLIVLGHRPLRQSVAVRRTGE